MTQPALITTLAELDRALEASREGPVLIFKHSLTCPISANARRAYHEFLQGRDSDEEVLYTLIEVQNAREVSEELARRTGIRHESPQALLLREGLVVWCASHGAITKEALAEAVSA